MRSMRLLIVLLLACVLQTTAAFAEEQRLTLKNFIVASEPVDFKSFLQPDDQGISSPIGINLEIFSKYPTTTDVEKLFALENTLAAFELNEFNRLQPMGSYFLPANSNGEVAIFEKEDLQHAAPVFGFQQSKLGESATKFSRSLEKLQMIDKIISDLNIPIERPQNEETMFCEAETEQTRQISVIRDTADITLKLKPQLLSDEKMLNQEIAQALLSKFGWSEHAAEAEQNWPKSELLQYDPLTAFTAKNCFLSIAKRQLQANFTVPPTNHYSLYEGMSVGYFVLNHLFSKESQRFRFAVVESQSGLDDAILLLDKIDKYLAYIETDGPKTSIDNLLLTYSKSIKKNIDRGQGSTSPIERVSSSLKNPNACCNFLF